MYNTGLLTMSHCGTLALQNMVILLSWNFVPFDPHPPFLSPQPPAATMLLSTSTNLTVLDSACKWDRAAFHRELAFWTPSWRKYASAPSWWYLFHNLLITILSSTRKGKLTEDSPEKTQNYLSQQKTVFHRICNGRRKNVTRSPSQWSICLPFILWWCCAVNTAAWFISSCSGWKPGSRGRGLFQGREEFLSVLGLICQPWFLVGCLHFEEASWVFALCVSPPERNTHTHIHIRVSTYTCLCIFICILINKVIHDYRNKF